MRVDSEKPRRTFLEAEQAAVDREEAAVEVSDDSVQEFDESTMTALLGQETTRVLDAARDAARDIRTRAEEESRQKIEDLEKQEKAVAAELEKKRTELDELTTDHEDRGCGRSKQSHH